MFAIDSKWEEKYEIMGWRKKIQEAMTAYVIDNKALLERLQRNKSGDYMESIDDRLASQVLEAGK